MLPLLRVLRRGGGGFRSWLATESATRRHSRRQRRPDGRLSGVRLIKNEQREGAVTQLSLVLQLYLLNSDCDAASPGRGTLAARHWGLNSRCLGLLASAGQAGRPVGCDIQRVSPERYPVRADGRSEQSRFSAWRFSFWGACSRCRVFGSLAALAVGRYNTGASQS